MSTKPSNVDLTELERDDIRKILNFVEGSLDSASPLLDDRYWLEGVSLSPAKLKLLEQAYHRLAVRFDP